MLTRFWRWWYLSPFYRAACKATTFHGRWIDERGDR